MSERSSLRQRKLRVLHVLRAPLGGLFRHVLDVAREQIRRGHAVGLVYDSLTCGEKVAATIEALRPDLELGTLVLPIHRKPHPSDITNLLRIEAFIREVEPDVIHGHGSKGGVYARAGALLHGRGGVVRCYTPHGGSLNHIARPVVKAAYMGVERVLSHVTDALLFESVYIASRYREEIGETWALMRIVHNGLSEAEFAPVAPDADAADFLYVGELRAAKGIDTLIDATALLSIKIGRPLRLVLVGSGPDREKLQAQAELCGLGAQVHFAGPKPAREAFRLGRTLVVPSRAESLPYIVLEAAAAQIPMIATDVGGIKEIFGPYRNRLIAPDDPTLMAAAMHEMHLKGDEARASEAAGLCDSVAARFSIDRMVDSILAGYREAAQRRLIRLPQSQPSLAPSP